MISIIINEITKKRLTQSELSGKIKFLAFHQFYQSVIPVKKKRDGVSIQSWQENYIAFCTTPILIFPINFCINFSFDF